MSFLSMLTLTNEQKYRYFIKLNTAGQIIDPDHMEKVRGMLEKERDK